MGNNYVKAAPGPVGGGDRNELDRITLGAKPIDVINNNWPFHFAIHFCPVKSGQTSPFRMGHWEHIIDARESGLESYNLLPKKKMYTLCDQVHTPLEAHIDSAHFLHTPLFPCRIRAKYTPPYSACE